MTTEAQPAPRQRRPGRPPQLTVKLSVSMPVSLAVSIEAIAERERATVTDVIRDALYQFVAREA